jgi:hypothetical protein
LYHVLRDTIIQPGDVYSLGKKILCILSDASKQKKMAISNFNKAKEYTKAVLDKKEQSFGVSLEIT